MIEAIVSFSLIGLGLLVWAASHLARRFYGQRRHDGTPQGDSSFLATLFSDGSPPGDAHHGRHDAGDGADAGHHGGDFGGGHH